MGLLDSVIGALGQAQGQGAGGGLGGLAELARGLGGSGGGDLLGAVVGMLGNDSPLGGLAGLVGKLQQAGLGDAVQSWVGTGQNLPVSADQLRGALGHDTVSGMAQQLGLDSGDLAGQLSQLLPQVVDKLTPHGQVPQGGLGSVTDLLGMLTQR